MALLYLALAYLLGIALGQSAWDAGLVGCATPNWLWLALLVALPFTPVLNWWQRRKRKPVLLRWPESAGFVPPEPPITPSLAAAVLLCSLMGALNYAAHPLHPCLTWVDLAYYNLPAASAFDRGAPQVTIEGFVSDYPLLDGAQQELQITADALGADNELQPVHGVLRLTTASAPIYVYGQPVRVQGRLVTPPDFETFAYRDYLARKGVHSLMYGAQIATLVGPLRGNWFLGELFALRARGEELLKRTLPEPYAALADGILLGIDAGIPDDLNEQFNLTGTSHVLVISGSNVAIIVAVLLAFFQRLVGARRAAYPTLAGIACYALLVGGDATVVRAALMGGMVVLAAALNRRATALISLAAACWAITLFSPLMLWDVGYQLSGAATASLILFTPTLTANLARFLPHMLASPTHKPGAATPDASLAAQDKKWLAGLLRGLIADSLVVTLAANVLVLPLIVYYFARVSVMSIFANLAIGPVQPLILMWGTLGLLTGVIGLSSLAPLFLWVAWLGLSWTVLIVEWSASVPFASVEVYNLSVTGLVVIYGIIFGVRQRRELAQLIPHLLRRLPGLRSQWVMQPATVGICAIGATLVWSAALALPDGRLHVYFLDVGQGDGIFIQTAAGRQLLIDGGSDPQVLFAQLGKALPFWDRTIDLVLLTHPDNDHMGAQVALPQRFTVTTAVESDFAAGDPVADPWRSAMRRSGAALQQQHAGGWIDLGGGAALWVLSPPGAGFHSDNADNDNSLVAKLVYGDFSLLLTGDASTATEVQLMAGQAPVQSTILKVSHHGSESSTSQAFLDAVNPSIAVIQVGRGNRFGHPTPQVLSRLTGRLILRTDQDGRVKITTDGRQMWVESDRAGHWP